MAIFSFIGALLTVTASIIATVMFMIFRNALTSQPGLNINAYIGTQMFSFMWIGAAFAVLGWGANFGMGCCCASERDIKTGRRRGARAAYENDVVSPEKGVDGGGKGGSRVWRSRVDGVVRRVQPVFKRRKGESSAREERDL